MSNRMTDLIRRQIIDKAVQQALSVRAAELHERELELGQRAYDEVVPKKLRDALTNVPPGWVKTETRLAFNANGWHVAISFPNQMKTPLQNHVAIGSTTEKTADDLQKLQQDRTSLEEERQTMKAKMGAMLATFYTFKQMRDRWPAGKAIYDEFDFEKSNVPMIIVEDINKMLGITEEEDEA